MTINNSMSSTSNHQKFSRPSQNDIGRISCNELSLIADVLNGTIYTSCKGFSTNKVELDCLTGEIADSEVYSGIGRKWEVSTTKLIRKLVQMPAASKAEMLNLIIEGWRFHRNDLIGFFRSLNVTFVPLSAIEPEAKYIIGATLASGELVVDRYNSHIKTSDIDSVFVALNRVSSEGRQFLEQEVIFPKSVGLTACVSTTSVDEIIFAQRKGRNGLTRFVRGRDSEPCSSVFLVMKRVHNGKYVVITGFVGSKPEPEPWDDFSRRPAPDVARANSVDFWANHALVWSPLDIVPGTETTVDSSVI